MTINIAIMDCGIVDPAYNCINQMSDHFDVKMSYHWVSRYGIKSLDSIKKPSGYIITGSHSNVCDRLDWQVSLAKKMKEEILKQVPTFGICFGHQLIADAFGGSIDLISSNNVCYEGTRVHTILDNPYNLEQNKTITNFTSHHYEVKVCPDDFIHLSTSKECFFDGLAHKNLPYLGFQGHPEASRFFVKEHIKKKITPTEMNIALEGGRYLIQKFVDLCRANLLEK